MTEDQAARLKDAVIWQKTTRANLEQAKDAAKEAREIHDHAVDVLLGLADEISSGQKRFAFQDSQEGTQQPQGEDLGENPIQTSATPDNAIQGVLDASNEKPRRGRPRKDMVAADLRIAERLAREVAS